MDSKKIKVFVVDASEVWRKILINHIASAADMEVVGEINSGQGSILMLEEVNPDVVMLESSPRDRMPAYEVVSQLKSVNPNIHIILCTDQSSMDTVMSAADKGAHDFVTKPYKRQLVLRCIRECANRSASV